MQAAMRIGRPVRQKPGAVSNQNAGIGDSAYSRTQSIGDGVTNYPSYRVPIENRTGGTDAPTGAQRPNPAQPAGYQGRTGGKLPAFRRGPGPAAGEPGPARRPTRQPGVSRVARPVAVRYADTIRRGLNL
jgi:hypothetical protein